MVSLQQLNNSTSLLTQLLHGIGLVTRCLFAAYIRHKVLGVHQALLEQFKIVLHVFFSFRKPPQRRFRITRACLGLSRHFEHCITAITTKRTIQELRRSYRPVRYSPYTSIRSTARTHSERHQTNINSATKKKMRRLQANIMTGKWSFYMHHLTTPTAPYFLSYS